VKINVITRGNIEFFQVLIKCLTGNSNYSWHLCPRKLECSKRNDFIFIDLNWSFAIY